MMAVFSDICEEDEEVTDRIKALPRVLARLPEKSRKVLMMSFGRGKRMRILRKNYPYRYGQSRPYCTK